MTISEFIQQLSQFDPKMNVQFGVTENNISFSSSRFELTVKNRIGIEQPVLSISIMPSNSFIVRSKIEDKMLVSNALKYKNMEQLFLSSANTEVLEATLELRHPD